MSTQVPLSRRTLLAGLGGGLVAGAVGVAPAQAAAQGGSRTALIVIDVQVDFCEGGSLGVTGGQRVAHDISRLLARHRADYSCVVATRDWHIDPGGHFSATPDYVDSWPVHCVAGTRGAQFHPALDSFTPFAPAVDVIISKGQYSAAYSGFEGVSERGRTLAAELRRRRIDRLDVVGIATDYCVQATVLDGLALKLPVRVLTRLCAGVSAAGSEAALRRMSAAGAVLTTSRAPAPR